MSQDASFKPAVSSGGSAASQAYRASMGHEATPQDVASASPTQAQVEARNAIRRKLSGRVRLTSERGVATDAKMIDMSASGACLLVEDMVQAKTPCTLTCNIFHEGKAYVFSVRALSVYSVLASGKGFKVGFQFGPRDEATAAKIAVLMR